MAWIPFMNYGGYLIRGSQILHEQVIISDEDEMKMNTYYVSFGPLPGIY